MKSVCLILLAIICTVCSSFVNDIEYLTYIVNPKKQNIQLYWKDDKGAIIGNFMNLKKHVELNNNTLLFTVFTSLTLPCLLC